MLFQRIIVLLITLVLSVQLKAQSQEKAYALHILNFARNIQWPVAEIKMAFTIGVFSYAPLVSELQPSAKTKTIDGRKIIIKEITAPSECQDCQILFVPSFKSKSMDEVMDFAKSKSVLVVSNAFGKATRGDINFILKEGKLVYEIQPKRVEGVGMKISTSVKSMGILVE